MRVNKSRELVVGGYVANGKNFDSIVVGYYEGDDLRYVARVRNGFTPSLRDAVFKKFRGLEMSNCPFVNLPQRDIRARIWTRAESVKRLDTGSKRRLLRRLSITRRAVTTDRLN
jgi:bifunctional non-homologous end joining protein LigD